MSLGERPRGSARPTPNEHYNSLPRTSIEGALGTWMNKGINRARAYKDPGPVDYLPPYPAALQVMGGVYPASYSPRLHPATGLVWSG